MNRGSAARHRAKHLRKGGTRAAGGRRAAPPSPEDRAVARLVVCGAIFVLLVAVKLLFPETVSRLADAAGALIGRDADFQEAFAAMGRAISGEEAVGESLQDAYAAVFSPGAVSEGAAEGEDRQAAAPADPPEEAPSDRSAPEEALPEDSQTGAGAADAPDSGAAEEEARELSDSEAADDTATRSLSRVYTMPALPDNASLEQRSLGFAYQSPVLGTLSSPFGWRDHPIDGENKFHYGVDLAAEEGTDICAFADGEVYATGESSTLGNYIMLEHPGGYITLYAHCRRVTAAAGPVAMGEKIAEVGDTGAATGPHLHFELHDGSLYLNPIYYVQVG